MNAQPKLTPVPAIESPATDALRAARAAHDGIADRLNQINAEMQTVEQAAAPSAAAASAAASLRHQRAGILGRMLRRGRVDAAAPEVRAVDQQLMDAEQNERSAAAVAEAKAAELAGLQAEANELLPQLQAAQRELALAQLNALGAEITGELVPALRTAAASLGSALAALVGAGKAHCELARRLREQHGVSVSALGTDLPARTVVLNPVGFGISDNGSFNSLVISLGPQIDSAHAAALRRWR